LAAARGVDEIMIIGGAQVYCEVLPLVQRAYVTEIDAVISGDTFFPALDGQWRETAREKHAPCEKNPYPYSFVVLEKSVLKKPV
jgi:dihydrofolate reductase